LVGGAGRRPDRGDAADGVRQEAEAPHVQVNDRDKRQADDQLLDLVKVPLVRQDIPQDGRQPAVIGG